VNIEGLIVFIVLNNILIDWYLNCAILFNEALKERFKLRHTSWRNIVITEVSDSNIDGCPLNLNYTESINRVRSLSVFEYLDKSVFIKSKCCEFFNLHEQVLRYLRVSLFYKIIIRFNFIGICLINLDIR
jgi:hypothetical protein